MDYVQGSDEKTAIVSHVADRRSDAVVNQARIVEAAAQLFAEQGVSAEMKDIAERAGVGVGTIYRNFPTKDDLVATIAFNALDELALAFAEAESEQDPIIGLRRALTHLIGLTDQYGWLVEILRGGTISNLMTERAASVRDDPRFQSFQRLLQRAISAGTVKQDIDIGLVAAVLTGATTPWSDRTHREGRTAEESANEIIDIVLQGIAPK